jgi:hypothetical protein
MFLSQPLLDVLIGRDIRDVDEFLRQPSFSDLSDPFSIPNLRAAADRVSFAIKEGSLTFCPPNKSGSA